MFEIFSKSRKVEVTEKGGSDGLWWALVRKLFQVFEGRGKPRKV